MNSIADNIADNRDVAEVGSCDIMRVASDFFSRLTHNSHILIAVSGGSDSLGLLVALQCARFKTGRTDIVLSAATIDHKLRREAANEAALVGEFCVARGISHQTLIWNEEKPRSGIMEAARNARYRLLANHAVSIGADLIAVAHTMDDQAETLSMREARHKAGNDGSTVTGMANETLIRGTVWICRPFLNVRRNAIRAMLVEHDVKWMDDPSNDDLHYERVRVRRQLTDNGSVKKLWEKSHVRAERRQSLSNKAAKLFVDACCIHSGTVAELDAIKLRAAPAPALYLLNTLAAVIGGRAYGLSCCSLQKVGGLLTATVGTRMTASRCLFEKREGRILIVRERRGLPILTLSPGENGIWDERYRVKNCSPVSIVVKHAGAIDHTGDSGCYDVDEAFSHLPRSLTDIALAVRPAVEFGESFTQVRFSFYFSPFDRFLPVFDLNLANAVTKGFGHSGYSAPSLVKLR